MRRFPISWDTTLTSLGFKRKVNRIKREAFRRKGQRLETLETRAMLTTNIGTEVDAFAEEEISVVTAGANSAVATTDSVLLDASIDVDAGRGDLRPDRPVEGDANADRGIDLLDLRVVGTNWGKRDATLADGDVDGDGVVGKSDWDLITEKLRAELDRRAAATAKSEKLDVATAKRFEFEKMASDYSVKVQAIERAKVEREASFSFAVAASTSEPTPLAGDTNGDGRIDLLDLDTFGRNYGSSSATADQGDFNGDGIIDQEDLGALNERFGIAQYVGRSVSREFQTAASTVPGQSPGDANGDGKVNTLDLDIFGGNFGMTGASFSDGDFNGDGVIDLLDLDILGTWMNNCVPTGEPSVSGFFVTGQTLTADPTGISDDNGLSNAVFTYQWLRDGLPIDGATNVDYVLTSEDAGRELSVEVSFVDDDGLAGGRTAVETVASDATLVHNATFVVNSLRDHSDDSSADGVADAGRSDHPYAREVTLRAAIEQAASSSTIYAAAGVTPQIVFADHLASGLTIELNPQLGQLSISSDLVITGPGADLLTIDANASPDLPSRVFEIADVGTGPDSVVTISDLTITGGYWDSLVTTLEGGGGIRNFGDLTLDGVRLTGNSTAQHLPGGALYSAPGASLTVKRTEVTHNTAGQGGGFRLVPSTDAGATDTYLIEDSTFAYNVVSTQSLAAAVGGALFVGRNLPASNPGHVTSALTIRNSTFSQNEAQATFDSGGVLNKDGAYGGLDILNVKDVDLDNVTVFGNAASTAVAGAIIRYDERDATPAATVDVSVHNSLFAGNEVLSGGYTDYNSTNLDPSHVTIQYDYGGNLVTTTPGGNPTGFSPANLADLGVSALGDHGGSTRSHALLPGSVAINTGVANAAITEDQRGVTRDPAIDVGAYESRAPSVIGDFDGDGHLDSLTYEASTKSLYVTSTGSTDAGPALWASEVGVGLFALRVGDFNGDGRDDLAYRVTGGEWILALSESNRFNVRSTGFDPVWVTADILVGDFDGDDRDELIGRFSANDQWKLVDWGDGSIAEPTTTDAGVSLASAAYSGQIFVGDANRDGRDDLIASSNPAESATTSGGGALPWDVSLSRPDPSNQIFGIPYQSAWGDWFDQGYDSTEGTLNAELRYDNLVGAFRGVYNEIELELYPGLMKGPQATAETKAGNAWDQAALLVNRLEAAGFNARIASGVIEVGFDELRDWLGVKTNYAALQAVDLLMDNGAIALNASGVTLAQTAAAINGSGQSAKFTHAWVEVEVFGDETGLPGFVSLDPSWKFKSRAEGIDVDLTNEPTSYAAITGRTFRGTFDEFGYLSDADRNDLPIEWYQEQVATHLASEHPGASLADVAYDGPIIRRYFEQLPAHGTAAGPGYVIDNPGALMVFESTADLADDPAYSHTLTTTVGAETPSFNEQLLFLGVTPEPLTSPVSKNFGSAQFLEGWYTSAPEVTAVPQTSGVEAYNIYAYNGSLLPDEITFNSWLTQADTSPDSGSYYNLTSAEQFALPLGQTFFVEEDSVLKFSVRGNIGGSSYAYPSFAGIGVDYVGSNGTTDWRYFDSDPGPGETVIGDPQARLFAVIDPLQITAVQEQPVHHLRQGIVNPRPDAGPFITTAVSHSGAGSSWQPYEIDLRDYYDIGSPIDRVVLFNVTGAYDIEFDDIELFTPGVQEASYAPISPGNTSTASLTAGQSTTIDFDQTPTDNTVIEFTITDTDITGSGTNDDASSIIFFDDDSVWGNGGNEFSVNLTAELTEAQAETFQINLADQISSAQSGAAPWHIERVGFGRHPGEFDGPLRGGSTIVSDFSVVEIGPPPTLDLPSAAQVEVESSGSTNVLVDVQDFDYSFRSGLTLQFDLQVSGAGNEDAVGVQMLDDGYVARTFPLFGDASLIDGPSKSSNHLSSSTNRTVVIPYGSLLNRDLTDFQIQVRQGDGGSSAPIEVSISDMRLVAPAGTDGESVTVSVANVSLGAVEAILPVNSNGSGSLRVTDNDGGVTSSGILLPPGSTASVTTLLQGPTQLVTSSSTPNTFSFSDDTHVLVSLDANQQSHELSTRLAESLNTALLNGDDENDLNELLAYTGAEYWRRYNEGHQDVAALTGTLPGQGRVGSGVVTSSLTLYDISGGQFDHLQFPILPVDFGVDLPNASVSLIDITSGVGNFDARQLTAWNASALENAVLEQVSNVESISTLRGLKNAFDNVPETSIQTATDGLLVFEMVNVGGTPVVSWSGNIGADVAMPLGEVDDAGNRPEPSLSTLDGTNAYSPFKQIGGALDQATLRQLLSHHEVSGANDVADALWSRLNDADETYVSVIVPYLQSRVGVWEGSVNVAENSSGRLSYTIRPTSGNTSEGGASGGRESIFNLPTTLPTGTYINQTFAGDPVNIANGSMFRDETDIVMPNVGFPLDLRRHYDSQDHGQHLGFGTGWSASFSDAIFYSSDNGVATRRWHTSDGLIHSFRKEGDYWQSPPELNGLLDEYTTADGDFFRYRDTSGLEYHFEVYGTPPIGPGRLLKIVDQHNRGIVLDYANDISRKLVRAADIADPGNYISFTRNGALILQADKYIGNAIVGSWAYGYDDVNRLRSVTNPEQEVTSYDYYLNTNDITKITESDGSYHRYEYYANGRVFRVTEGQTIDDVDHDLSSHSFSYNLFRNSTEFVDENGHVEEYFYNDNGNLIRQVHDDSSRFLQAWGVDDGAGGIIEGTEQLMTSRVDQVGATETFDFFTDANDFRFKRLRESTVPHFQGETPLVTQYAYTQATAAPHIVNIASVTADPAGENRQTTYNYDSLGRLESLVDAEFNETTFSYYGSGLVETRTDPRGQFDLQSPNYLSKQNEAVNWRVLDNSFEVTGGSLTVQLEAFFGEGYVIADAVRIERVNQDGEGHIVRIVDDYDEGFDRHTTGGVFGGVGSPGNKNIYGGDARLMITQNATQENVATWTFHDLTPGNYRVATNWIAAGNRDSTAEYRLYDGDRLLEPSLTGTLFHVDQTKTPASSGDHYNAFQTKFYYDGAGNLVGSKLGEADESASGRFLNAMWTHHHTGGAELTTDGSGRNSSASYDSLGRLLTSTQDGVAGSADDLVTTFTYDERGRIETVTDALGRVATNEYDYRGNVTKATRADGTSVTHEYDGKGNRVATTDALGRTTRWVYDSRDRLVQTIHADGASELFRYDGLGRLSESIDALGRTTRLSYTADGLVTKSEAAVGTPDATATVNKYNLINDLIETIDGEGNVTQFFHDDLGRVVKTMVIAAADAASADPDSSTRTAAVARPVYVETMQYDRHGNVVESVVYDTRDASDRIGDADLLSEGLRGLVDTGLAANGGSLGDNVYQTTAFTYDNQDRLTQTRLADGTRTLIEYDGSGRVRFTEDQRGARTELRYDEYGRLTQTVLPDAATGQPSSESPILTSKYDEVGNLVESIDPNGNVTTFEYDSRDRLVAVVDAVGARSETLYDLAGQAVAEIDADGVAFATRYDARGRATSRSWVDPDGDGPLTGPRETFVYDAVGNLVETTDARGFRTWIGYDNLNRVETEEVERVELDETSLTLIAAASNALTVFHYDRNGNLKSVVDPRGGTTAYTYDERRRRKTETLPDPDGSGQLQSFSLRHEYDGYGNVVSTTEVVAGVDDRIDRFDYDEVNRLTAEVFNDGSPQTDPDRIRNEYAYDAAGNLAVQTTAVDSTSIGATTRFEYDLLGRLIAERTDAPNPGDLGRHYSTFEYDKAGNLIAEAYTIRDDANGLERSTVTGFEYDPLNRAIAVTEDRDGIAATSRTHYDRLGNVVHEVDPTGIGVSHRYDALNRLVETTGEDPTPYDGVASGLTQSFAYDLSGNLISVTNGEGETTTLLHDSFGQVVLERAERDAGAADDLLTFFAYDTAGDQVKITDPNGNVTRYAYDDLGRVTKEIQGTTETAANTRELIYNNDGNLELTIDRNGRVVEYGYDGLDRLVREDWHDDFASYDSGAAADQFLTWDYDKLGRLDKARFQDDSGPLQQSYTDGYDYDTLDRLVSHANGEFPSANPLVWQVYTHDVLSGASSAALTASLYEQHSFPSDLYASTTIETDRLGRTIRIDEAANAALGVAQKTLSFGYDAAGRRRVDIRLSDTDGVGGNDFIYNTNYAYDPAGRLSNTTHYRGSFVADEASTFSTTRQDYDNASRITDVVSTTDIDGIRLDRTEAFDYDKAGRLSGWDYVLVDSNDAGPDLTDSVSRVFQLDAAGNRDAVEDDGTQVADLTIGGHNRLTDDGVYAYTYDNEGNLTSRDDGSGDRTEYRWDHRNRLVEVLRMPAAGAQATDRVRYVYNNDDLRVRRVVEVWNAADNAFDIVDADTEHYVYDRGSLAAVIQGAHTDNAGGIDDTLTNGGAYKRRVLSHPDTGEPVYEEEFLEPPAVSGQLGPRWSVTDHAGTVRDVVAGADEALVEHREYDAFGDLAAVIDAAENDVATDALAVDAAFAARSWDDEAGLYYNHARWYDAAQGRFVSEDPIGLAADANLYRYAAGDPVNLADPTGLAPAGHPVANLGFNSSSALPGHSGILTPFVNQTPSLPNFNPSLSGLSSFGQVPNTVGVNQPFNPGTIPTSNAELFRSLGNQAQQSLGKSFDQLRQDPSVSIKQVGGLGPDEGIAGFFKEVHDQIDADETPLLAIGQKPLKLAAQLARMTFNSFEVSPSFRATFEDGSSRVLLGGEPTSGTLANQALALVPLAVPKGFVAKPGAAPTPRQQLTTQATATADPSDLAQFTSQIDVFPSKTVVSQFDTFSSVPSNTGGPLAVPQRVFTATDGPVSLSRPRGTFVTEIDITNPRAFVRHVDLNVPPSAARPSGALPRYVTEINVPSGTVLPDPTVPFKPGTPTGFIRPGTPGARINRVFEVTEDATGGVRINRADQ